MNIGLQSLLAVLSIRFGQYFSYSRSLAFANFTTVIVTTTRFYNCLTNIVDILVYFDNTALPVIYMISSSEILSYLPSMLLSWQRTYGIAVAVGLQNFAYTFNEMGNNHKSQKYTALFCHKVLVVELLSKEWHRASASQASYTSLVRNQ